MFIRCWGSRGSIPVSGTQYLRYGGDSTCMEVRSERDDIIVVDAGTGIRSLGLKLGREKVRKIHLLMTHAHFDHVVGFPFFAPPLYRKGTELIIHGCPFDRPSYAHILKGIMTAPYCPVDFGDIPAKLTFDKICSRPFKIGSITVRPIYLSHPNGGVGFRFEEGGKSFVFLTDNELEYVHPGGLEPQDYADFSRDADLLIHDAEYTQKDYNASWGHSVFTSAVKLGLNAGAKRLGMFHLNQKRSDDEVDAMVDEGRKLIEKKKSTMECFAVGAGFEMKLV